MQNPTLQSQLREVRRLCRLGALEPDELEFWVNTDAARDPESSLRQRIISKLEDEVLEDEIDDLSILVYGHGGSGKSTELIKLTTEIGNQYFVVRFSALEQLDLLSLNAADLLVVLVEQVIERARQANLEVRESALQAVYQWFAEEKQTTREGRESQLAIEAEVGVGGSLLALAKLMASLKSDIKFSSGTNIERIVQIRQRPGALVNQVNDLLDSVRLALPSGQRLLIIIEDLDKLDIGSARRVFIEEVNLLSSVKNANLIFTIPIFTFHSPDAVTLRTNFGACLPLPMIKVMEFNGRTRAAGFQTVAEIIRRRVTSEQLTDDAMELLIEKTGGVLQHVFEVINTAASMTTATIPLQTSHIEYGLMRKTREFYSEITLPYSGIPGHENLVVQDLYDCLAEHARTQLRGRANPPKTDAINQVLLKCCALVEYNGKSWHGVHPLVMDILRETGAIGAADE